MGAVGNGGNGDFNSLLNATLHRHRVGAGSNVAKAFTDHRPGQDSGCGGTVAGYVISLLGDLFDQLSSDSFVGIFKFDLFGNGNTVVGDGGGAPLLLEHHVAALGSEGDSNGVSELIHPRLKATPGLLIELNGLCHYSSRFIAGRYINAGTRVPRVLIQSGRRQNRNYRGSELSARDRRHNGQRFTRRHLGGESVEEPHVVVADE